MTDAERQQVYVAETASLSGTPFDDAPGPVAVRSAFDELFGSPWWASLATVRAPTVTVTGRHASGAFRHHPHTITIGELATWLTMAHEAAHAVHHALGLLPTPASGPSLGTGRAAHADRRHDAPHGSVFRGCELAVFTAVFGGEVAAELASGFRRFGLAVAPVDWAAPPVPVPLWFTHTCRTQRGGWRSDRRTVGGGDVPQRDTTL